MMWKGWEASSHTAASFVTNSALFPTLLIPSGFFLLLFSLFTFKIFLWFFSLFQMSEVNSTRHHVHNISCILIVWDSELFSDKISYPPVIPVKGQEISRMDSKVGNLCHILSSATFLSSLCLFTVLCCICEWDIGTWYIGFYFIP